MGLAKPSTTLSGRVRFNRILADACFVSSLLAVSNGNYKDAAKHAKQCVMLNRRVWSALEAKCNARRATELAHNETNGEGYVNANFDPLSSMRNDKGVPLVVSNTHESLDGADFWTLVPSLYRGMMQHSLIFAHEGFLQEAVFVAEQAEKIVAATNSRSLILDNTSRRAELWAQSGRGDKAKTLLDSIDLTVPYNHLATAQYYSSIARMHHVNKDVDGELLAYETMETLLAKLVMPSYIATIDAFSPSVESLAKQMSAISLTNSESKDKKSTKSTRGRKPATKVSSRTTVKAAVKAPSKGGPKTVSKTIQPTPPITSSVAEECLPLSNLQADVACRKALAILLQDNVSKAIELLEQAQAFEKNLDRNVTHLWASYKITLFQSMKELAKDFTFNSLQESTIAFPAISQREHTPLEGATEKRSVGVTSVTAKSTRNKQTANETFIATLREARERLVDTHALCFNTGSSHSFQQASYALSQVTVLLSAVSAGEVRGSLHPLYAAYMGGMSHYPNDMTWLTLYRNSKVKFAQICTRLC